MIDYVIIGERIREFRKSKGWTQAVLAEKSGVEPSNVSHIERAATKVSLPTLICIANALGVTLDELVYSNLSKSSHITAKIINELLEDCTDSEIKALAEIMKTVKKIIKTHNTY